MWIFLSLEQINEIKSRISTDPTRTNLIGAHIDLETNRIFATDGHRMAVRKFTNHPERKIPFDHVIPQGVPTACARIDAIELVKQLKKRTNKDDLLNLTFGSNVLTLQTPDGCVTFKHTTNNLDSEPSGDGSILVDAQYLLDALTVLVKKMKKVRVVFSYYGDAYPMVLSLDTYPGDPNFELVMPCNQ